MDPNTQKPAQPEPNPTIPGNMPSVPLQPAAIQPTTSNTSSKIQNLIQGNSKVKYGLIIIVVPVAIAITLLRGGSPSDVFSDDLKGSELRTVILQEVNYNQSKYGFHINYVGNISCDGSLKRFAGEAQTCTAKAERIIAGNIEGKIRFTVIVSSGGTQSTPPIVRLTNIQKAE